MSHYDYRVVPAPKRAKRVKGVSSAEELFALTLTDTINEVARQGWEYVRAEHLPSETSRGWLRSALATEQSVLVFRRSRESAGPRLATVRDEVAGAELPPEPAAPRAAGLGERMQPLRRSEPTLAHDPDTALDPGPVRPPRLGPAERA